MTPILLHYTGVMNLTRRIFEFNVISKNEPPMGTPNRKIDTYLRSRAQWETSRQCSDFLQRITSVCP